MAPNMDPRSKYPRPPFREQHQTQPGDTDAMTPRPDHGEESYVGTGRLSGMHALITGGDSGIGRAVASRATLTTSNVLSRKPAAPASCFQGICEMRRSALM